MEEYQNQIIETIVVLVSYWILKAFAFKLINKTSDKQLLLQSRGMLIKKLINAILLTLCVLFVLIIWGVKQSDLALFLGSALTIVGVAFFAQWSLLSNVTSSIILFFNHPIRLNDSVAILEGKEYVIEGKITNIGVFFITLQTAEGEELTLPNNVFIQKIILKKNSTSGKTFV